MSKKPMSPRLVVANVWFMGSIISPNVVTCAACVLFGLGWIALYVIEEMREIP